MSLLSNRNSLAPAEKNWVPQSFLAEHVISHLSLSLSLSLSYMLKFEHPDLGDERENG